MRRPQIIVTQPRRLAAVTLAQRVAHELGESVVGQTVGYRVGMERIGSQQTQLVYATAGYVIEVSIGSQQTQLVYATAGYVIEVRVLMLKHVQFVLI